MATAEGRTIPFTGVEAIDVAVLETFPYDGPEQEIVTTTGEFSAVCNEFCSLGHHVMVGKLIVTE